MQRRLPSAAIFVAVALLASPAALAEGDDWEGFFVDLDAALATPGNTNTPILSSNQPSFSACAVNCANDTEWMEWDDDVAYSISFGYSFGEKGALKISYWTYDDTATSDGNNSIYAYSGQLNWMTIGPLSTLAYSYYNDFAWNFDQKIEASTIDLEYMRTKSPSENLKMSYAVGLRFASFEDSVSGVYNVDPNGGAFMLGATRTVESDGFGFTGSFGIEYHFSEMFGIGTDLRLGFLTADVDSESTLTDMDGYYLVNPGDVVSESSESNDELATTIDFNFDFIISAGDIVDVEVGYFYSTWSDMAQFQGSRSGGGNHGAIPPVIQGENRDRISWSGPRVAVKLKFGK